MLFLIPVLAFSGYREDAERPFRIYKSSVNRMVQWNKHGLYFSNNNLKTNPDEMISFSA